MPEVKRCPLYARYENSVDITEFSRYAYVMIERHAEIKQIKGLLKTHPVVGIIGARQVGKTTLAQQIINSINTPCTFFDLENPEDLSRLSDPMLAFKNLKGLVVIDEIQEYPDIFRVLRVSFSCLMNGICYYK